MINLIVKCHVFRFNGELKNYNILSRFISTAFMWLHSTAIFLHVVCLLNSSPIVVLSVFRCKLLRDYNIASRLDNFPSIDA